VSAAKQRLDVSDVTLGELVANIRKLERLQDDTGVALCRKSK
jgi:hypothetical protein